MKHQSLYAPLVLVSALTLGCQPPQKESSKLDVTRVQHSEVKRQAIGNCWLYATASWLESELLSYNKEVVNVSETYWTYWDLFEKIKAGRALETSGDIQTGGGWEMAKEIIKSHGWIEESAFQAEDQDFEKKSRMQSCAIDHLKLALAEGGSLAKKEQRTEENIRRELDKGFSCHGSYPFDWNEIEAKVKSAQDTILVDATSGGSVSLLSQLEGGWYEAFNPLYNEPLLSGKQLPKLSKAFEDLGVRIRRALNDHKPVILSFKVSFNAVDDEGVFNLDTLAAAGDLGKNGGHMVVLHDYTVEDAPGFGSLGEGELSSEQKAAALKGKLDTLVAKNSWGSYRWDRPWIKDGYTRFTWDYLSQVYFDKESQENLPFLQSVVLPIGY